jgi:hypothetical protein
MLLFSSECFIFRFVSESLNSRYDIQNLFHLLFQMGVKLGLTLKEEHRLQIRMLQNKVGEDRLYWTTA